MRKSAVFSATLAGALFSLPALAEPILAGTTWADDYCMVAFEFHADYTFLEYDVWGAEYPGRWSVSGGALYLNYDNGESVQTTISDEMFSLSYGSSDDEVCYFVPD